jgi:predicted lipid-binding transport protein (Tim44 family)
MGKTKIFLLKFFSLLCLLLLLAWALPAKSLARSDRGPSKGKSSGTQGSQSPEPGRSPKTEGQPAPPSPTGLATTASRGNNPSASKSTSSFWRSLQGGFLGGLLGRWLFGAPAAQAAPESGESYGFGLLDLIFLVGLGYFIYWLITKKRRLQTAALQSASHGNPVEAGLAPSDLDQEPPPPAEPEWDLEKGLRYIERSDPLFSEQKFKGQALDYFFKIQGAWVDRNLSTVKHLLTKEMFDLLQKDVEKMRQDGLVNRLQHMAVHEVNLTEAWQEAGQDYLTVRIYLTLLDYTINERTGEIVSGSKFEPVRFEEYWTFTRPSGNNPWQLSAISQAE